MLHRDNMLTARRRSNYPRAMEQTQRADHLRSSGGGAMSKAANAKDRVDTALSRLESMVEERLRAETARSDRALPVHLAPIFGATLGAQGLLRDDALRVYLYTALRGLISASVRLGLIGPHEGQRLQARHGPTLDDVLASCGSLRIEQAATTAPLLDVFGAMHDRLYARLFQS